MKKFLSARVVAPQEENRSTDFDSAEINMKKYVCLFTRVNISYCTES